MAAILQLRQGSTSTYITQGPNIAEPFFDTGSNILVVGKSATEVIKLTKLDESNLGSFDITGDYSGSNLYLTGDLTASNATLSGDITIGGNIILGDEIQDNITISGQFNSDLIPSQSLQYNLGSQTKKWNHLYASSASIDNIDLVSNLPSGTVSGSTQITDGSGIVSSSNQITDGSGIVSSSNQIDTGSTHFQEGVALYSINGVTPLSGLYGSANGLGVQIRGLSADGLSFDGPGNLIIDTGSDYFVSGAQQASLLGLPQGTVSSSQQVVDFLPTNTVSGSVQVLGGTNIVSSSVQVISFLPSGTVSGSQQIIDSLPTGTVSGSSQISELTHIHSFTSSYTDAISLNGDDVTILGNLTVQGTQTQLNTATLNIEDKNLLIASGAADSSAANGAGITIDGANKSLEWEHGTSQFVFNAQISSSVGFKGDGSNLTGLTADSVEYDNILNKPTLISGSGQVLGGTNIVSSSQQVTDFLPSGTISGSIQVLGGTDIISSSNQVVDFLPSGTISGSIQITSILESTSPGLVSGSDQITESLDIRYLEVQGDGVVTGSDQLTASLDSVYAQSSSLYDLVGNFPTSGSLGTAAFYNVSSSLGDDPNVIPNVKAVFDYINNTIGAADITGVSASLGLSGGGDAGYVSMSLDTGSTHFQEGVELYSSTLPSGTVSGSSQITNQSSYYIPYLSSSGIFADSAFQYTRTEFGPQVFNSTQIEGDLVPYNTIDGNNIGLSYLPFTNVYANNFHGNFIGEISASNGIISSSQQVVSYLPTGIISGSSQLPSGLVSGSSQLTQNISTSEIIVKNSDGSFTGSNHYADSINLSVGSSTPTSVTSTEQLTVNGTTSTLSGVVAFTESDVLKSFDYVSSDVRFVDTNSGVSIALKPDADGTKAWLVDTDGDLVSNGGAWTSGNAYMNNLIASSSVTASNMLVDFDITADNFIGNLQSTNGVVSGSSQITKTLQEVTTAGSTTSTTISITNATASTSITTGALVVTGGIGTSGDVFAGGDIVAYASSDRRLKDEIQPISNPLEKINQIGGYSFIWNTQKQDIYKGKDYGVVAQEIEEILPELVQTRENGYKAVKYDKLVSLLIEGIKELSQEVNELKEKLNRE